MFAGIGGADLAIEQVMGARSAWQLDLVGAAVRRRHWPDAMQIEADVRTVDPRSLASIDVLAAGFPCQDLSCAGKGGGLDGERSGLYVEVLRFTAALSPRYVIMENVPPLLAYMPRLVRDFAGLGYGLTWTTCRAIDAGHPHLRRRVFVLAERGATGRGPVSSASTPGVREGSDGLAVQVRPWPTPLASGNATRAGSHDKAMDGLEIAVRTGAHLVVMPRSDRRNLAYERGGVRYRTEPLWAGCRPWATPTATDCKTPAGWVRPTPHTEARLGEQLIGEQGSRLDPDWVEQLMGYPVGWTDPTGPLLRYDPHAPAVRGRYPASWDRSQVWPGYDWEHARTLPDGPAVKGRPERIRALGNAWCPQQGALALRALLDPPAQGRLL